MLAAFFRPPDVALMKRMTKALAFLFLFTAGYCHVERTYRQKFFDLTGEAQWIWPEASMTSNEPLAFYAARDVDLPANRTYTRIRICGDPEYTLWVNGRHVASRRVRGARVLDSIDVSDLVRTGPNRFVVAVRAPQGFGGLIASIDLAPEKAAWLVTDERWKIYRRWNPGILLRDVPGTAQQPMVIGEPPVGSWDFLPATERAVEPVAEEVFAPSRAFRAAGLVPAIRTSDGVAVAVADRMEGTVFDFGPTRGRLRLTVDRPGFGSRTVNVRFANEVRELERADPNLRPVVFAPGESAVTTSEEASFRYVMVFGRRVRAEVVRRVPSAVRSRQQIVSSRPPTAF